MSGELAFPWEREAMRGEEMPEGLSFPDQMAYTTLRNVYQAYYNKIISRDVAAAEKGRLKYQYERAVRQMNFDTEEVFSVSNPDVTATDKQNIKKISDATLVSPAIAPAVAQRVYEYYLRRNTNKSKIVYNGEKLGDCLTIPNSWGSANTGNLAKMEIKLSNTVVYSSESKGV